MSVDTLGPPQLNGARQAFDDPTCAGDEPNARNRPAYLQEHPLAQGHGCDAQVDGRRRQARRRIAA